MKKSILLLFISICSCNIAAKGNELQNEETMKRIRIKEQDPQMYALMQQFDKLLEKSELTLTHRELIKIRVSQLNNCGYCLNLHTKDALKNGEDETRIYMLPLWKKVPMFYADEELVILQMAEEITFIGEGLSDDTYNKSLTLFSPKYVAQLIMAITIMNSWNRIGVATHMEDECAL